ncbi:uncharacterized protein [Haliotis cracherodii]|uniref:uncharacterized protein n=1 Tax=Haliotis cracherodii TaxID=6455 RepID=UPI0039EB8684
MQRKDEATTSGSTAATGSTTSTEAKGSTTQSTVTASASAPSTATTTQTVTDEANLPQDDPTTAHGSPEPRISVKGTDGQGTTGQSVASGVVHGQHITQGNTYNITVHLYGASGEGMSQRNQPGPISFIINMDGSGKLQDIQARETATTHKDKPAYESTWSFITKPVNYALHFTSSLCSALYTLHASVVARFNGRFQGARPGSLIFVFQHDTWEEAEEMMRHKKDVTDVIVQFLQHINSGVELLECDVQIKALKQTAEDLLDKGIRQRIRMNGNYFKL